MAIASATAAPAPASARGAAIAWDAVRDLIDEHGYATVPELLTPDECRALAALYAHADLFRSRVVMQKHAFGRGEYQYFKYPLPAIVDELRHALYPPLAGIANRWRSALRIGHAFPSTLDEFLAQCHAAGQPRPTPLVLKYEAGDYNCLHQDLYGEWVFPLQLTVMLSDPDRDFTGGEFLLVEQRPRAQSKGQVVPLRQGEAVIFPVRHRPAAGKRGNYRLNLRHGVSHIRTGRRYTLGIIFHDAA